MYTIIRVNVYKIEQEAFEKCWAHSPLRAAARRLFYIAIHQVSLLSHAACASMSTTTSTTKRQRVTEGTAMAPWNGPNKVVVYSRLCLWCARMCNCQCSLVGIDADYRCSCCLGIRIKSPTKPEIHSVPQRRQILYRVGR